MKELGEKKADCLVYDLIRRMIMPMPGGGDQIICALTAFDIWTDKPLRWRLTTLASTPG